MKEKAQYPLAARSTSRPIFAPVMGYKSLVDTCKSSSVLIVVNHYVCALYFVLSQFTLSIVECHPSVISAESLSCI